VIEAARHAVATTLRAYASVLRNRELRLVELSWAVMTLADFVQAIAITVFAYEAGGAGAVGLAAVVRVLPSVVLAPLAGTAADRYPRERVMLVVALVATAGAALAAVSVAAEAPAGLVYVLGALVGSCDGAVRPAQAALLPSLSPTPEDLTAGNALSTTVESVGIFVGPAIGALLLALVGIDATLAATVVLFAAGAALIAGVHAPRDAHADPESGPAPSDDGFMRSLLGGLAVLRRDGQARLVVALFASQTLVNGALNVFLVVVAVDLGFGADGVGVLLSAIGVGGVLGALVSGGLGSRRRLATGVSLGILLWGLPIVVMGLSGATAPTLAVLVALGVGNTITDVAGVTLLQRIVPDEVLARVLGVLESVLIGTFGLGALLAPPLLDAVGTEAALVATGAGLAMVAVLSWRPLAGIEAELPSSLREVELLRKTAIFAPLDGVTLDRLASQLEPVRLAPGETLFVQGAQGDRFYLVASGEVEVLVDGRPVALERPGEGIGEIALLRDVPRTATVRAKSESELWALGREPFLAAVTAHPASDAAARGLAASRLGQTRPGFPSLA
jgi:MFS family permease